MLRWRTRQLPERASIRAVQTEIVRSSWPPGGEPTCPLGNIDRLALHHRTHPRLQGIARDNFHPSAEMVLQEELEAHEGIERRADGEVDQQVQVAVVASLVAGRG